MVAFSLGRAVAALVCLCIFVLEVNFNKFAISSFFGDCKLSLFAEFSHVRGVTVFHNLMVRVLFSYTKKMFTFSIHKKYKKASCF